jgi:ferredoxin-NADP reductase
MSTKTLYGTEESMNNFQSIVPKRRKVIEGAPETPIDKEPNVNRLARLLHPKQQFLVISDVIRVSEDTITYKLISKNPDEKPAYFMAGQYLCIQLTIGDSHITRPYSISSSPDEALEGYYMFTIKNTQGGFASQYIHENWRVGTLVETSGPEGTFCHNELRDAKTVIAIAGGSGITPFYSMAKDIVSKNADFNLTILYGCRTEKDILFKDEFKKLVNDSAGKLKIVFVLSDEKKGGYEHGFITADVINKYAPDVFSAFICGPQVMYNFVNHELSTMNISRKLIRRELFGQVRDVSEMEGYPKDVKDKVFKLSLKINDKTKVLPASSSESILIAIERSGLKSWSCCRSGECGQCRGRVISGNVYTTPEATGVRLADKKHGIVHSCASYPLSDLEFELL